MSAARWQGQHVTYKWPSLRSPPSVNLSWHRGHTAGSSHMASIVRISLISSGENVTGVSERSRMVVLRT
jgi:hypothetical protein